MKKVAVLFANGFEEVEALTVVDYLRRVSLHVDMVSIGDEKNVKGASGVEVIADKLLDEITGSSDYDCVVLPGGLPGSTNLRKDERVIDYIQKMDEANKYIAAICAAPIVLHRAGLTAKAKITSYPGIEGQMKGIDYSEDVVTVDKNIVTSRGPATAVLFALKLAELLTDEETAKGLKEQILFPMISDL